MRPIKEQLEKERKLRITQEEASLQQVEEHSRQAFIGRFASIIPDYVAIDNDPKFLRYMQDIDQASGYSRTTLFQRAVQNGDVIRAAGFYSDYQGLTKKDPLASKISPRGDNATKTTSTSTQKKEIISTAYINQFYDDVIRGRYRGKHSLQLEIEAKIDKAVLEGRIK